MGLVRHISQKPRDVKMEGSTDMREAVDKTILELREAITEIYQYYHGDPPHLQKIFDKWVIDE